MKRLQYWVVVLLCSLVVAFLIWRALLPNNRFRPSRDHFVIDATPDHYYIPQTVHAYDDVVTVLTARHFARDGFLRTHFLPNRGGTPAVSFRDRTQNQCEQILRRNAIHYRNWRGWVPMLSLDGDCIYTHYPPLADWAFAGAALLGANEFLHYKIIAIVLNSALLVVLYFWLRREFGIATALPTLLLAETLPLSIRWADALYYQPFQYLFLGLGFLSWGDWLRKGRVRSYVATWLLYFGEALVSYELTIFFGIAIVGLSLVEHGPRGFMRQWRSWSGQYLAPVMAFLLHAGLSVSLFGFSRVFNNLFKTAIDRVTRGSADGLYPLFLGTAQETIPWWLVGVGLALVVVVYRVTRTPLKRPMAFLLLLLLGGASFSLTLPGTASVNYIMMVRHFFPFEVFVIALVVNACFRALTQLLRDRTSIGEHKTRYGLLACVTCAGTFLGVVGFRNAQYLASEIHANVANNRTYNGANLALTALDVLYWNEQGQVSTGPQILPVSGLRVNEPPRWKVDFRLIGPARSHYEVWWLDPQRVATVRLLVDQKQSRVVAANCFVSWFSSESFKVWPSESRVQITPFTPEPTESAPRVPYSWVGFTSPVPEATRALRLTCSGVYEIALRQFEAYARLPRQWQGDAP